MRQLIRRIIPYIVLAIVVLVFYVYTTRAQDQEVIEIYENRFNEQQFIQVTLAQNSIEAHVTDQFEDIGALMEHLDEDVPVKYPTESDLQRAYDAHGVHGSSIVAFKEIDKAPIMANVDPDVSLEAEEVLEKWFIEYEAFPYEPNQMVVTPIYASPTGQWFAVFKPLISENGTQIGIVGVLLDFHEVLQKYIVPVRSGEFGAAWIQDHRGTVIFDHETQIIGQNVRDLHVGYPEVEALDRRYLTDFTGSSEYKFTVKRGGEVKRKLVAWSTIQIGDNYYTIALSAPDTEISQQFTDASNRNLRWSGLLLLLLFFGGIAIFQFQQVDLQRMITRRTQALETEQKRLKEEIEIRQTIEARLSRSEEIYRLIAQISSDYAFLVRVEEDGRHGIEWITAEAFERATGYLSEDYNLDMRTLMFKAMHPDEMDQLRVDMKSLMAGETVSGEYRLRKKDGEMIWLKVIRTPIWDEAQQRVTHYYGIGQDITQDKKNQELFVENERLKIAYQKEREYTEMRRKYLQTLAHEFRTPLTVINTSAALIDRYREKMSLEKQHKEFKKIVSSITYLDQMLTELSMLSRTEKGYLQFNPGQVDILNVCQDVVASFQETMGADHTLVFENLITESTIYWLDDTIMRYVLTNLISNAIKYSEPNTEVKLMLDQQDEQLIFKIIDQGSGISEEDQSRIFEPFYRGQNVDTIRGTGLGLAIAKEIVILHNGTLNLQSKVGNGSTFTVSIPIEKK